MGAADPAGTTQRPLHVAVIGAGPAGFYAAEALLKSDVEVYVDLFERLPAPYGLVRYGVAPDHQKIKNVTRVFDRTAAMPGFRFVGNVHVGVDVSADDLFEHYDQVIFTIGAARARETGISGERLEGSYAAVDFVGWYNGHPDYLDAKFRVDAQRAVVVGGGNVAADLTRILLRDRDELAKSDIAEVALAALQQSPVEDVVVLIRRGPAEMKMSLSELEEIDGLAGVEIVLDKAQIDAAAGDGVDIPPAMKKTLEYFATIANRPRRGEPKTVHIRFLCSPKEFVGRDGRVEKVVIEKNELVLADNGTSEARGTGKFEEIEAGLALEAIGYRGAAVPGLPFDARRGVIPNERGRVVSDGRALRGCYVSGWIKRGPQGLIGSNRADSVETVNSMLADAAEGKLGDPTDEPDQLLERLRGNGVRIVDFDDWRRLDAREVAAGARSGRVRTKFRSAEEMLAALDEAPARA